MSNVLIVGAGPAGASLAWLLAGRGIDVTLVERHSDFSREFRGEVLMPSGIDVFRQMGLGRAFDALPHVTIDRVEIHARSRRVFTFRFERAGLGNDKPRVASQPAMLEMLIDQCSTFAAFRPLRGHAVRDVVVDDGRAVGVRLAPGAQGDELLADYLVAADGRNSVVRRRTGLHEVRAPQVFDVVWCKMPLPDFMADLGVIRFYIGRGHLAVAFPSYDGRLQVGWLIAKGSYGELKKKGIEAVVAEMSRHMRGDLGPWVLEHVDGISQPFLLDVVCDRLVRWTTPGALLIGDAAHPMSPVGAQGINIALRDAVVAANHLVPVLGAGAEPEALDAAGRAFEAERADEVRQIQRMQQIPPRLLLGGSLGSRLVQGALPWLLRSGVASPLYGWGVGRLAHGIGRVELVR